MNYTKAALAFIGMVFFGLSMAEESSTSKLLAEQVADQRRSLEGLAEKYKRAFPKDKDGIDHIVVMASKSTCSETNYECNRVLLIYLLTTGDAIQHYVGDQEGLRRLESRKQAKK